MGWVRPWVSHTILSALWGRPTAFDSTPPSFLLFRSTICLQAWLWGLKRQRPVIGRLRERKKAFIDNPFFMSKIFYVRSADDCGMANSWTFYPLNIYISINTAVRSCRCGFFIYKDLHRSSPSNYEPCLVVQLHPSGFICIHIHTFAHACKCDVHMCI